MVTGNGQLRHALRERSAVAARFPHAYGGLLPARPGTPGIYFEYSRKLVTLVGLICCFLGAFGAAEYFFVRAGGQGRPLGALWPIFYNRTHPVAAAAAAALSPATPTTALAAALAAPSRLDAPEPTHAGAPREGSRLLTDSSGRHTFAASKVLGIILQPRAQH